MFVCRNNTKIYFLMNIVRNVLMLIAIVVAMHSASSFAYVYGAPAGVSPCKTDPTNVNAPTDLDGACISGPTGPSNFLKGQKLLGPQHYGMGNDFSGSYVPFSGLWYMKGHWCEISSITRANHCTIKDSSLVTVSAKSVELSSSTAFVYQEPDFGGSGSGADKLPFNATECFTLVDTNGTEWTTDSERMCSDGKVLPDYPSVCSINQGADLDVSLGALERSDIATSPLTSDTVKKSVNVLCTGDAAIDVKMTFDYTPISIGGKELIGTSIPNLGVALIYDGNVVDPTSSFQISYQPGSTPLNLEFEAVRDPSVPVSEIHAGEFTASATLILTQQ